MRASLTRGQAFVTAAAEAGAFEPFESLLASPFTVSYGEPAKKTNDN